MSVEIIDRYGGKKIVHNLALLDDIVKVNMEFDAKCNAFDEKMMEMEVKAYRNNDGWVDRKNNNITFFRLDKYKGWYWGNLHIKEGDLIFIGNAFDGGKFAVIDNIIESGKISARYHYNLIQEGPVKEVGFFRRVINKYFKRK